MRIIQIGVGSIGPVWLGRLISSKEWDVVGIVDINEENLKRCVEKYPFLEGKTYTSLKECLKKVQAEAILNLTPPSVHEETTIMALKNGLHALVEKPLSDSWKGAERIVETAEKYNRKLMVVQNYRYSRFARTMRKIMEEEKIGRISWCILNFQKVVEFSGFRKEMSYPLLIDMSIHHFDLARYILGKNPLSVYAKSWNPHWSWSKGDACVSAIFEFEGGIIFSYFGSWASVGKDTAWPGIWEIYGENGTIVWDGEEIKKIYQNNTEDIEPIEIKMEEKEIILYEFYESIVEDKEPETSGRDNLCSLSMVFKSIESAKKGKKVKISTI